MKDWRKEGGALHNAGRVVACLAFLQFFAPTPCGLACNWRGFEQQKAERRK